MNNNKNRTREYLMSPGKEELVSIILGEFTQYITEFRAAHRAKRNFIKIPDSRKLV